MNNGYGLPWGPAPMFGAGAPAPPTNVGEIANAISLLNPADKARLYALLGVAPINGVPAAQNAVPPGMTTRPGDNRLFRVQGPRERSQEFTTLVAAETSATSAYADYVRQQGWRLIGAVVQHQGGISVTTTPSRVVNANGVEQTSNELVRLKQAVTDAKAAVKTYKGLHPQEFAAPPQRGRGRGRGRGLVQ